MKIKKLLALMLALVLVLAACGGTSTDGTTPSDETSTADDTNQNDAESSEDAKVPTEVTEPTTIIFWHGMSGDQEVALTEMTQRFMDANENITVELQNQGRYSDLQQKLTATSTSPSDLPTITQAYPDWMFNPIQDGLVYDLTAYTEGLEDYDDILEGFRKGTVIDGKVYSMPFNKSTEVLWYNEDLFNELGLEVPTTYDELVEVSKAIYEAKGIAGAGFDSLSNYYTTFLNSKGQVYDSNFDVTSDISKEAVNYHLDGVKEGYFMIAGTDAYMSGHLGSENVGMYIGSNAGETYVLEGAAGKFSAKAAPAPTDLAIQQGTDIFVFNSADDNQKAAALKYITFLTSTEEQIFWGIKTGYIPARTSALESDEYVNSGSLVAPIIEEATKNLYNNPVVRGANDAYREAGTVMEQVLADPQNADVDAILSNFQNTLSGIWE